MSLKLGCIADDFTGAADLANTLVRGGMRTVLLIGVPSPGNLPQADAIVIALKSRTAPVAEAVRDSLTAARRLRADGALQIFLKICSTFDSTARGNIGPVAEALAELLQATIVPVTPAFPENGRTVYKGHLFVGEQLLSDSPMRQHPLTPMTDANLVRVLQAQCARERVGLVDWRQVAAGAAAIEARLEALRAEGTRLAIVDALGDQDLRELAHAARKLPLLVAGSGLGIGIPTLYGLWPDPAAAQLPTARGARAIVAGSCSAATRAQVRYFVDAGGQAFALDALRLGAGEDVAAQALGWARDRLAHGPVLVHATVEPAALAQVQGQLGAEQAGTLVEQCLAQVAAGLVEGGVGQLIVAGGETSGACVSQLGITQLRIGPQIDPGVPWCHASERQLHLALKSGNFGGPDLFVRAFDRL